MTAIHEKFGKNLREQRNGVGLTQDALAHACDVTRSEISLLERSLRMPRLDTVVFLARGLGLSSPAELLDGIR
ncbi:MAG: helix-turn-helix domain-containing protein [Solirubrobacterales bacterium]